VLASIVLAFSGVRLRRKSVVAHAHERALSNDARVPRQFVRRLLRLWTFCARPQTLYVGRTDIIRASSVRVLLYFTRADIIVCILGGRLPKIAS